MFNVNIQFSCFTVKIIEYQNETLLWIVGIQYVNIKYVLHHALQLALRVPKWNVFIYSIHSIDIQYVLHHALQLALRVPKWNVFYRFNTFNRHSICIAPCFAIFQCIFIVCLNHSYFLSYLLTYLHSYPKSRDAIASKNDLSTKQYHS